MFMNENRNFRIVIVAKFIHFSSISNICLITYTNVFKCTKIWIPCFCGFPYVSSYFTLIQSHWNINNKIIQICSQQCFDYLVVINYLSNRPCYRRWLEKDHWKINILVLTFRKFVQRQNIFSKPSSSFCILFTSCHIKNRRW